MTERPPHGSARPGGRTARTRAAVLAAAYEELDSDSFAELTLDRLARRSGVHVSTIRRRWRTVEGVVVDLLAERSSTLPTPDTGDFHRDLTELTQAIADFNNALRNRNVMQGLLAAAAHDTRVEEIVRSAFVRRTEEVTLIVRNAVERGDIPEGTDAREVIAALGAPIYYRVLILRGSIDQRLVHTTVEATYQAVRSGVFVRKD
ncbi:TetR/AcrR family transcriptional regulator C-terminal ligand-binding domain-containing protein [Streptomyces javensis]|uniref:TetR/AcrR family transcriptional regulator C-terminal ligand-binding domain-containing protein n=1 Tax=Streptomyces javensis TaxID=114698 RepID=A0ABS0RN24_9ACTN|nr:TetR/AcrR family transcriptional regulator C-terminal ligand-binding domain-containing protein [Streptomyces javensis]